jgi:hypothetical protein
MGCSRLFLFSVFFSLLLPSCGGETGVDSAPPPTDSGGSSDDSSSAEVDEAGQGEVDGTLLPTPSDGGSDSTLADASPADDASDSGSTDSSLDATLTGDGGPLADATSDVETNDAPIPLDAAEAGSDTRHPPSRRLACIRACPSGDMRGLRS